MGKTLEWTNAVSLEPSLDTQESAGGIDMAAECSSIEESSENELLIAGKKIKVVPKNGLGEFNESFIGSQIRLEYTDEATRTYKWKYDSKNGVKDYVTDWFAPAGKITVNLTGGNWDGVLILEESTDNGNTWSEIGRTVSIESSANEGIARETFTPNSICRVRMLEQNKVTSTTLNKIEEHKEGCFSQSKHRGAVRLGRKSLLLMKRGLRRSFCLPQEIPLPRQRYSSRLGAEFTAIRGRLTSMRSVSALPVQSEIPTRFGFRKPTTGIISAPSRIWKQTRFLLPLPQTRASLFAG